MLVNVFIHANVCGGFSVTIAGWVWCWKDNQQLRLGLKEA